MFLPRLTNFALFTALLALAIAQLGSAQLVESVPIPGAAGMDVYINAAGFSPKGTYFWVRQREQFQVWTTANRKSLWSVKTPFSIEHVAWTPDEQNVALAYRPDGNTVLVVHNAQGQRLRQHTLKGTDFDAITLLPGATKILGHDHYQVTRTRRFDLEKETVDLDLTTFEKRMDSSDRPQHAITPDGKAMVAATRGTGDVGGLRIWNLATGEKLADAGRRGEEVFSFAFLPEGKLVTAHNNKTLKFWDMTDLRNLMLEKTIDTGLWGARVNVSADGTTIALIADTVLQLRSGDGELRGQTQSRLIGDKTCLSHDGKMLLTPGDEKGHLTLWPITQLAFASVKPSVSVKLSQLPLRLHTTDDGKWLFGNDPINGLATLYDAETGKESKHLDARSSVPNFRHSAGVDTGRGLLYGDVASDIVNHSRLVQMNPATGAIEEFLSSADLDRLLPGRKHDRIGIAPAPGGAAYFLTVQKDWVLLDRDRKPLKSGKSEWYNSQAVFSPDGKWCVRVQDEYELRLHQTRTGEEIDRIKVPSVSGMRLDTAFAFGPEGKHLYWIHSGSVVRMELSSGKTDYPFPLVGKSAGKGIVAFTLAPKAGLLAVGTEDATIRVFELSTGKLRASIPLSGNVEPNRLTLSPDGKSLWAVVPLGPDRRPFNPLVRPEYADRHLMRWNLNN